MTKLWYMLYIRWLALQWMFQLNIGDRVIYRGVEWTIINGVSGWSVIRGEGETLERIDWLKTEDLKKVRSIKNYHRSYRSGVNFYTSSWLSIWCNEGIKPWVRALNIWPRKSI